MQQSLVLRKFQTGDVNALVKHGNNPDVAKYLRRHFPCPYTKEHAQAWINSALEQNTESPQHGLHLAIVVNNECIGSIGATRGQDEHQHTAEIGYWIGQGYWGRGWTTRALKSFTDIIFGALPLKRVYAAVPSHNAGSIRVLQKCGYKHEALFKSNLAIQGQFYDEHIYAYYRN